MVILNDSTARGIAELLTAAMENYDGFGDVIHQDQIPELIKATEPMRDACGTCKHEDKAGYEEPCVECVYATALSFNWEAKS